MRKLLLLGLLVFTSTSLLAQIQDPVDVTHSVKRISDTEAELRVTATMDEGWHIYSVNTSKELMVIGTELNIPKSDNYRLVGKVQEPEVHTEYDENFQEELSYVEGEATFTQRIKILASDDFEVEAEFVYQTCDDEMCLPPEYVDLTFEIKGAPESALEDNDEPQEDQEISADDVAPGVDEEDLEIDYSDPDTEEKEADTTAAMDHTGTYDTKPDDGPSRSLITLFILSFLGGFAALLTPCVFPMIPLTVSFFTKQSKSRAKGIGNALIYGVAIVALYTGIGFIITKSFGSDALNAFSTNPYVNIAFFVLLVVFAISFFGAFEITLPSSWVNRTDRASDRGGVIGIIFMAFTLALVSFSCTGPIIGGLLAEAASGGVQGPLIGMFGFSLALALPFTLFAVFPGWLNSLPKSGGWLNSVKVVLGFIELAFAFKFLSNADLVWDAGLLLREHFIAIWIAIFALITVYLLGGFRMPHDSPVEKISVPRLLLAVFSLTFVIYLIPGMWGAPLKLISGFPPPGFYAEAPGGFNKSSTVMASVAKEDIPEGATPDDCPHNLNCFHDFDRGLEYAKEIDKPVLIDFTGKACVNCRKMEDQVWSDPRVLEILGNDVVLVSLYVDLQKKLPEDEQYVSPVTGKKIRSVGNKWSEFQVKHYQTNSQPQYVIIGHDSLEPLIETTSYDPDTEAYIEWLERGIEAFEEQQEE